MALIDDAISRIRSMVLAGELVPGQKLPPERELGRLLGLAKNSLREQVRWLGMMGVFDIRPGDGTYVTSLKPDLLLKMLSFVEELSNDQSILELLEVRRILETAAVAKAAARVTEADLVELRILAGSANEDTPAEELMQNDLDFHLALANLAGNSYLATLLERISSATVPARMWRGLAQEGSVARTIDEHVAIVNALADHDSALAEALTDVHTSGVENWLHAAIE